MSAHGTKSRTRFWKSDIAFDLLYILHVVYRLKHCLYNIFFGMRISVIETSINYHETLTHLIA